MFKNLLKGALSAVEKGLLKLVDENMSPMMKESLKAGSAKLIDDNYDKLLGGMQGKLRGWIDKIDGEANLPPLPAPTPEPAAEPAQEPAVEPAG